MFNLFKWFKKSKSNDDLSAKLKLFHLFKPSKSTGDLLTELKKDPKISEFLERNKYELSPPLHEYLTDLLTEKHLTKKEVIKKSCLSREYAYHIFSGVKKNPSRPKILAIGIAMGLTLDEIQTLLKYAKMPPLYPRNRWDAVIISAISQHLNVMQTNELLVEVGETEFLE